MASIEGERPTISLVKEYIRSSGGVIFDRKSMTGGEILIARTGEASPVRPTFNIPKGNARRMPSWYID